MSHDGPAAAGLSQTEADRRKAILDLLKQALSVRMISSELVGRRTLVLHSPKGPGPHSQPARQADPQLYVFADDAVQVVTTDGWAYRFASGFTYPVADPGAAARLLARSIGGRC